MSTPVPLQSVGDILFDGHVREQRVGLEHHIDRALVGRNIGHVGTIDIDAAGGWIIESGQHAQQRRLATARSTEHAEQLAPKNLQIYIVNGGEGPKTFGDPAHLNKGFGVRVQPRTIRELVFCFRHRNARLQDSASPGMDGAAGSGSAATCALATRFEVGPGARAHTL